MQGPTMMNLVGGIWFSMSNGTLLFALMIAFGIGFVTGYIASKFMDGRRHR